MKRFDGKHQRNPPSNQTISKKKEERFYKNLEKVFKGFKHEQYKASKRLAAAQLSIQIQKQQVQDGCVKTDTDVKESKPENPLLEEDSQVKINSSNIEHADYDHESEPKNQSTKDLLHHPTESEDFNFKWQVKQLSKKLRSR